MTTEYRLAAKDREHFGLPEWITFDRDALDDTPFSVLTAWEKEMATSVVGILTEWEEKTSLGVKGAMWLSLKLAGGDCPAWDDFDIRTTGIKQKVVKPAPLAEASSLPSSETEESPQG